MMNDLKIGVTAHLRIQQASISKHILITFVKRKNLVNVTALKPQENKPSSLPEQC